MSEQRAHALLSASSAHRWLRCPMSATAEAVEPERDTEYSAEGTLAHEVAAMVASGKGLPISPPEGVTPEMIRYAEEYRDYIQEHIGPNAIMLLEQRLDFSPWVPQGFGTGDCLIFNDGHLTVVDYKYGVGVPVDAVENDQMRCYALGALNDYGTLYDVQTVTMAIFQPRIGNVSEWTVTVDELMEWAEQTLEPAALQAFKGEGGYHAGPWCKFCRHAGRCRELAQICEQTVELYGQTRKVESLAPWEIDAALRQIPMVELWTRRLQEYALETLMAGKEIPGQKLVEGRATRKWRSPEAVLDALADALETSDYMTEPELMSPAALEKSIGKARVTELVGDQIDRQPGKVTVAPAEDKRPAYVPGGDFESYEGESKNG